MACTKIHTPAENPDTGAASRRRLAGPVDLTALFELDRLCFGRRAWSLRAWWEVVTFPEWTAVVIEEEQAVAAASVLLLAAPVSWLASLAVHPDLRRRGLGRALVRDALVRARAASAGWLSLEVDRSHRAAVALYRSEGFGVARRFREDGRWRQEMVRRLGGVRGT
ncbi:MAG TPA: GNAT family N-acetyltransferase [Thermoanaerobaculaceae bacterium]|nr:GNAT family N-acetyltransferase [Thermoanaerobaculaceae bacterium]